MFVLDWVLGYVLTLPFLVVLLTFGILFEHNSAHFWAIFTGIIATTVAYFYFKFPMIDVLYGVVGYAAAGVVWSFYRYKRFVSKKVDESRTMNDNQKEYLIKEIHPTKMLGTITSWIIIWPFSVIDNLLGDLISAVETLVKTVFRGVYNKIYASAVSQITSTTTTTK